MERFLAEQMVNERWQLDDGVEIDVAQDDMADSLAS